MLFPCGIWCVADARALVLRRSRLFSFLVLRKQLIWCFASIKRDVTIVISYENILQLMTTLFFYPLVVAQLLV